MNARRTAAFAAAGSLLLLAVGCVSRSPEQVLRQWMTREEIAAAGPAAKQLAKTPTALLGLGRALPALWNVSPDTLSGVDWLGENWNDPLFVQQYMAAAAYAGLWVRTDWCDADTCRAWLKRGCVPGIVRSAAHTPPGESAWAMVAGWTAASGEVVLFNARGFFALPEATFHKRWCAQGFLVLAMPPERAPPPETADDWLSLGRYHEFRNEGPEALKAYEQAEARLPEDRAPHVRIGNVLAARDRWDEAESRYRRALEQNANGGTAANNLAYVLARRGIKLEEAEQLARRAVRDAPDDPRRLDTLGVALTAQGRWEEAAQALERARGKALSYPLNIQVSIARHLAEVYDKAGYRHLHQQVMRDVRRWETQLKRSAGSAP